MNSQRSESKATTVGAHVRERLLQPDGSPIRVLVLDEDRVSAEIASIMLSWEGAEVCTAYDSAEALTLARKHRPDLLVLDSGLPETDAASLLLGLRRQRPEVLALILLAGETTQNARVARMTVGCDYLPKPFSVEELSLRVRILLNRRAHGTESRLADIVVGDLVLSEEGREVTRAGRAITLTYTEFELLRFFMRNPDRVLSKAQILARVWPYGFSNNSNIVELYVSILRKKIHHGAAPVLHTLRLTGYVLKPTVSRDET